MAKNAFAFRFESTTCSKGRVRSRRSQRGTRLSSGGSSRAKGDDPRFSQSKNPLEKATLSKASGKTSKTEAGVHLPRSMPACERSRTEAQRAPENAAATSGRPGPRGSCGQVELPRYGGWEATSEARQLPSFPVHSHPPYGHWAPAASPAAASGPSGSRAAPAPRLTARAAPEHLTTARPLGPPAHRGAPQLPGERCLLALLGPCYFLRLVEDEEETYGAHSPPLPDGTHVFCKTRAPSLFSFVYQGCAGNKRTRGTIS